MNIKSKDFMKGWLQAFFDGEGSIYFKTNMEGRHHTSMWLSVVNTDFTLIDTCSYYFIELGIKHTISNPYQSKKFPHYKPIKCIKISRQSEIKKFYELINFVSPAKALKLQTVMDWIDRPKTQSKPKSKLAQFTVEQIAKYHLEDGLSLRYINTYIIGRKKGCAAALGKLLKSHGYPIRICGTLKYSPKAE